MTLKELKEDFYDRSSTTSGIIRQLALGGVALTWLFKAEDAPAVSGELGETLRLFIFTIGLDLAHALVPTLLYGGLHLWLEHKNKGDENAQVEYPGWMTFPAWFFFGAKAVLLVMAYLAMYTYLLNASVLA